MAKKTRARRALYDPSVDPNAEAESANAEKTAEDGFDSPSKARQLLQSLDGLNGSSSNRLNASLRDFDSEEPKKKKTPTKKKPISPLPVKEEPKKETPVKKANKEAPKEETIVVEKTKTEEAVAPAPVAKASSSSSFFTKISSVTAAVLTRTPSDQSSKSIEPPAAASVAEVAPEDKVATETKAAAKTEIVTAAAATEIQVVETTESSDSSDSADTLARLQTLEQEKDAAMQMATRLSVGLASARAELDDWQTQAEYWKEQFELLQAHMPEPELQDISSDNAQELESTAAADTPTASDVTASPKNTTSRRLTFWKLASPLLSSKEALPSTSETAEPDAATNDKDEDLDVFGDDVYMELFAENERLATEAKVSAADVLLGSSDQVTQLQQQNAALQAQLQAAQARLRELSPSDAAVSTPVKNAANDGDNSDNTEDEELYVPPPPSASPQSTIDFLVQEHEKLPDRWSAVSALSDDSPEPSDVAAES